MADDKHFERAFHASPNPMALSTLKDGRFVEVNAAVVRTTGYAREELIGRTAVELGLWLDQERAALLSELRAAGVVRELELTMRMKSGELRNFVLGAAVIDDPVEPLLATAFQDITERHRFAETLRQSEVRYRKFIEDLPLGIVVTQLGSIKFTNMALQTMIGYSTEELHGQPFLPFVVESDRANLVDLHQRRMRGEAVPSTYECRFATKSGEVRHWHLDTRTTDWDGMAAIALVTDVTEAKRMQEHARRLQEYLQMQIDRMPIGLIVWDEEFRVKDWNPAATQIFGFTAQEALGKYPYDLIVPASAKPAVDETWNRLLKGDLTAYSVNENISKDGRTIVCEWTNTPLWDGDGKTTGALSMVQDVTARKTAEERIHELAFFDPLTGLPNRTLLHDRLTQVLTVSHRSGNYGALLLIDLDNFKTLNDTRGHDAGDLLLKQAASRLKTCVRECDTVARLGGDEFVAVFAELGTQEQGVIRHTEEIASKLLHVLNQSYLIDGLPQISSASIGVTLFKGHESSADDLLKQADLAMYRAKAGGRNAVRFFDPPMEAVVRERAALEEDLRLALGQQQFLLHYQAQVTGERRVTGAEVLLRWQHPQRGMVQPADFIPVAEETGLIVPLGHWVLKTACKQLASWASHAQMSHLKVSVNVSINQFRHAHFVDEVLGVLKSTGANPHQLKLEITESLLAENVPEVIEKMSALQAAGVSFSLDDFGTGYSSLSYLKRLPLSEVKIDRSFVRDVLTDPNDAAIAKTIVALAQSLGLGVIAEGVETSMQRDFLADSGCYAYQGYFFSKPLPLEEFEQFVQKL